MDKGGGRGWLVVRGSGGGGYKYFDWKKDFFERFRIYLRRE